MAARVNPAFHPANINVEMMDRFPGMWLMFGIDHPHAVQAVQAAAANPTIAQVLRKPVNSPELITVLEKAVLYLGRLLGDEFAAEQLMSRPLAFCLTGGQMLDESYVDAFVMEDQMVHSVLLPEYVIRTAGNRCRLAADWRGFDLDEFRREALIALAEMKLPTYQALTITGEIDSYCETARGRSMH